MAETVVEGTRSFITSIAERIAISIRLILIGNERAVVPAVGQPIAIIVVIQAVGDAVTI
jgi:hypothetical protein